VSERAVDFGDVSIPLSVRRSAQARRIGLRIDPATRGGVLTLPLRCPLREGLRFVTLKALWLRNRIALLPEPVPFSAGVVLSLCGETVHIEHRPGERGGVWREGQRIVVTGAAEHLARRLTDWFKQRAREDLGARTRRKADILGQAVRRVAVRDTRSRWGSCARDGSINYSWRLVFAPEFVIDYVVAHEVAHLRWRGHGPRFRAAVDRLTAHRRDAEDWLRRFGTGLLLIGRNIRIEPADTRH
jgi:predicted metal-dependent hydrolase